MIQTRKTGSTISCLRPRTADRARLPVTMPRNSDSDMCRAGQSIASMQSDTGLDEHGRLHGVSDLSNDFADLRTSASNSWSFSAKERKRRWRILAQKRSQIRRQDKAKFLAAGVAAPKYLSAHCFFVFGGVVRKMRGWHGCHFFLCFQCKTGCQPHGADLCDPPFAATSKYCCATLRRADFALCIRDLRSQSSSHDTRRQPVSHPPRQGS